MLPVWQKAVRPFVESGEPPKGGTRPPAAVVLGVVQEQHPDRAKLYKQWRQLDWPILVDSLNLLDLAVVPVPMAIDESGILRHKRLRPSSFAKEFLNQTYPRIEVPKSYNRAHRADPLRLRQVASETGGSETYRQLGDAFFLQAEHESLDQAIAAYQRAIKIDPQDGRAHFRLGVALRKRAESEHRQPGDAQAAVAQWGEALAINPNQYIWRRRIQQYGPRLDKPYNFYSWVEQARQQIKARGEQPVPLATEPTGSELVAPSRERSSRAGARPLPHGRGSDLAMKDRDPQGKVARDSKKMVNIETMVTPVRVQPGQRVRVRTTFRLNEKTRPYWNNETGEGLSMSVDLPSVMHLAEGEFSYPNPASAETQEDRVLEFELTLGENLPAGEVELPAYALYYVCENKGGKCLYLRQDFTLKFQIDPKAPKIR